MAQHGRVAGCGLPRAGLRVPGVPGARRPQPAPLQGLRGGIRPARGAARGARCAGDPGDRGLRRDGLHLGPGDAVGVEGAAAVANPVPGLAAGRGARDHAPQVHHGGGQAGGKLLRARLASAFGQTFFDDQEAEAYALAQAARCLARPGDYEPWRRVMMARVIRPVRVAGLGETAQPVRE
jgi:hypothetical protein